MHYVHSFTVLFKINLYKDNINHILINSTYWVEKGGINIRAAPTGSEGDRLQQMKELLGSIGQDCCSSLK